jgi:hypothetical protein
MIAPNHALTGALIGLTASNPILALPLAFISHFALDAVPHYDPSERDLAKLYRSKMFLRDFILVGGLICFLLVIILALSRPRHWLTAAICAFLAASPDLLWFPWYLRVRRTGDSTRPAGWFYWLHGKVQWKTGPHFGIVEAAWFVGCAALLWQFL